MALAHDNTLGCWQPDPITSVATGKGSGSRRLGRFGFAKFPLLYDDRTTFALMERR